MMPRCAEIDELIGPFALDALDPEERLLVLEHLSECRNHDTELAAHREVAALLPMAIEEMPPPSRLRGSLLREFESLKQAGLPQVAASRAPARRNFLDLFRRPAFSYGIVVVLMLAVTGLTVWNLSLRQDGSAVMARTTQQGNASLRMVYLPDERLAVLDLDLPALTPDRAYQAWQITPSGPASLGLVPGHGPTALSVDLSDASAIAISVEPAGGSLAPTTTPLLVTEL
jgi:anti-sigma-K factor RskA